MALTWITADDMDDPDNPDVPFAISYASWILFKLTGEKYPGVQTAIEWYGYRKDEDFCFQIERELTLQNVSPQFIRPTYKRSQDISLRQRPVIEVESVKDYLTGEEFPLTEYDLRNHAVLHKVSGTWDLTKSGILVEYLFGMEPPEAGKRACWRLAEEILKSITDPDNCALPERVTSVSRQGVDYTLMDSLDFIEDGRTGIYEVDLFIKAANPVKAYKQPRVLVPGAPRGETITRRK